MDESIVFFSLSFSDVGENPWTAHAMRETDDVEVAFFGEGRTKAEALDDLVASIGEWESLWTEDVA